MSKAVQAKGKRNLLRGIKVHEVSIVDRGAVKRTFAFRKADDTHPDGDPMDEEIIKACLETALEDEEGLEARLVKAGAGKKGAAAIKYALRILAAHKDEMSDAHRSAMAALAELDDDEPADAKKKTKAADDAEQETSMTTEKADKTEMSPEVKAHFERLQKAHEAANERAAKLEKAMHERDEADKLRVCVEKARAEYPSLGEPAKVGELLKRLDEAGLTADVENILKAAVERDRLLKKELGSSHSWGQSGGDSAYDRLQRAAVEIAKRDNLPIHEAQHRAMTENKELYDAYERERRAAVQGGN